jgi:hypothetical protein
MKKKKKWVLESYALKIHIFNSTDMMGFPRFRELTTAHQELQLLFGGSTQRDYESPMCTKVDLYRVSSTSWYTTILSTNVQIGRVDSLYIWGRYYMHVVVTANIVERTREDVSTTWDSLVGMDMSRMITSMSLITISEAAMSRYLSIRSIQPAKPIPAYFPP